MNIAQIASPSKLSRMRSRMTSGRGSHKESHIRTYLTLTLIVGLTATARSMELFQVRLVEKGDGGRLIATSNYNYAITSPTLMASKDWRTISVNGDQVNISTTGGQQQSTTKTALGADMSLVESLRDEIASSHSGYSHTATAGGGGPSGGGFSSFGTSSGGGLGGGFSSGSFMMSSGTGGTSSHFSSSTDGGTTTSNMMGGGEMSYNMKDSDNFSVARADLPYNWSRVFFNGDLVTFVHKNGDVRMVPISLLEASQLETVERLKREIKEMQRISSQQVANTMQHSMDMVSNVFNSIMGNFPRPPSFESAVGNMFGNNFPFGPNNSPFGPGWPFGGGAAAMAVAGRRR